MPELHEFYSTKSVGLRFREAVKKTKERGKKTYKMGRKNMAGKKLAYVQICGKTSKIL